MLIDNLLERLERIHYRGVWVMAEKKLEVGGMNFRVFDERQDLPVLFLHGFPDSSYVWRKQIPALTAAGYRTIVPDLRGFGESARPEGVENYTAKLLLGDIIGILDDLEISKPHVIGHDWAPCWRGFSPAFPLIELKA